MRTLLRWAWKPVFGLILRVYRPGDAWEEFPLTIPFWRFGAGSRHRFSWYYEGESVIEVTSLEEVVSWLAGCTYVADKDLFQEQDFWQHPRTFERLRQGDCEDFALWAWRKLNELDIPAHLFVGQRVENGEGSATGHAWVVFEQTDELMVLEGAGRTQDSVVAPLEEVRHRYRPHYSVDGSYRTTAYAGWLTTQKEEAERTRKFGRADIVGG
jgi:hypothetical protein